MKKNTFLVLALALVVGVFTSTTLFNQAVKAATCLTEVITGDDISEQPENTAPLKAWVLYKRAAGEGDVRTGPETPPLGIGSYELTTPTGADKATLFNFEHTGTALEDINKMSYSTYRTAGNLQQVAAINLQVDVNGAAPGGFTTLVFEPVYNTEQGAVVSGEW
jgi:hypothetical protein